MEKIKTYISNLPIGVKWIVGINFVVYIITVFVELSYKVRLQDYLGAYPTYSDNFNPLQIISRLFIHKSNITHLIINTIIFLIFSPFVENKFGTKRFIIVYLLCGIISYVFMDYASYKNKIKIESSITNVGVNISDIKIKNFKIDDEYLSTLNLKQKNVVKLYSNVLTKTVGASSAISGIVFIYLFFNIRNFRKKLPIILSILIGCYLTMNFIKSNEFIIIPNYGHFGGLVGGILVSLFLITKKGII
jgi:membrane associated rhomboid family serine protease